MRCYALLCAAMRCYALPYISLIMAGQSGNRSLVWRFGCDGLPDIYIGVVWRRLAMRSQQLHFGVIYIFITYWSSSGVIVILN